MKFIIAKTPNSVEWPSGKMLSIDEAQRLLAQELAARQRMHSSRTMDSGFEMHFIPETGDRHGQQQPQTALRA